GQFEIVHTIGCNTQRGNVVTIQNIQPAKKLILDRLGRSEKVSPARRLTRWMYLNATCAAEKRLYQHREGHKAPMFLPVSRGVAAELQKHYNIGPAQVLIVPNAADTVRFKQLSADARNAWRAADCRWWRRASMARRTSSPPVKMETSLNMTRHRWPRCCGVSANILSISRSWARMRVNVWR
ncbi:MAG: hypothetical protein NTY98_06275, partial [Verrucomicrobia bacterium]|nr:hypothetical protein [Verrucomicrobiota bacterium]